MGLYNMWRRTGMEKIGREYGKIGYLSFVAVRVPPQYSWIIKKFKSKGIIWEPVRAQPAWICCREPKSPCLLPRPSEPFLGAWSPTRGDSSRTFPFSSFLNLWRTPQRQRQKIKNILYIKIVIKRTGAVWSCFIRREGKIIKLRDLWLLIPSGENS